MWQGKLYVTREEMSKALAPCAGGQTKRRNGQAGQPQSYRLAPQFCVGPLTGPAIFSLAARISPMRSAGNTATSLRNRIRPVIVYCIGSSTLHQSESRAEASLNNPRAVKPYQVMLASPPTTAKIMATLNQAGTKDARISKMNKRPNPTIPA
jgi:hypothetical protein